MATSTIPKSLASDLTWKAGDSVTIMNIAGRAIGRVTNNGQQAFVVAYLGKPITASSVAIRVTGGTLFYESVAQSISAQNATIYGIDKKTGTVTFTFNLSSSAPSSMVIVAETGMEVTFS